MPKTASTSIPVHEFIAERWSPRSFDASAEIDTEHILAMLEAARWAPSAMNMQPWRFAVAMRGSEHYAQFLATLSPGNSTWAHRASALIVAATETQTPEGKSNPWAQYDLGLAVSLLTVQAHSMGLHIHQMGGFDRATVASQLALPDHVTPIVVLAVGRIGEPEQLEGPLLDRELSARQRKPLDEILLAPLSV